MFLWLFLMLSTSPMLADSHIWIFYRLAIFSMFSWRKGIYSSSLLIPLLPFHPKNSFCIQHDNFHIYYSSKSFLFILKNLLAFYYSSNIDKWAICQDVLSVRLYFVCYRDIASHHCSQNYWGNEHLLCFRKKFWANCIFLWVLLWVSYWLSWMICKYLMFAKILLTNTWRIFRITWGRLYYLTWRKWRNCWGR